MTPDALGSALAVEQRHEAGCSVRGVEQECCDSRLASLDALRACTGVRKPNRRLSPGQVPAPHSCIPPCVAGGRSQVTDILCCAHCDEMV
jgi:hypothetical protein